MNKKYHYVYYSYEEWGRGYIGSRSCSCSPQEDKTYFGSFTDKTFSPTNKIILSEFESHKEALEAEILLHEKFDVSCNPHFANRARATSKKFTTSGLVYSKDSRKKMSNAALGRKPSESALRKRSVSLKEYFCKNTGLRAGRNNNAHGKRWFTDGSTDVLSFSCPVGFCLGRKSPSEETRRKQSISRTGKKHSKNTVAKMRGENNPMYGRTSDKAPSFGKSWYTNGEYNTLSFECPQGYYKGRTMS